MSKVIGIDISKQTFDLRFVESKEKWCHEICSNDIKGFKKLMRHLSPGDWVVMEASGPYYLSLAYYLHNKGVQVSVVNPLVIKRYSQTKLSRAKTDKKDARVIAEYGSQYPLKKWVAESLVSLQLRQINTSIELVNKQIRQSKNQLEAFVSSGIPNKDVEKALGGVIKQLEKTKDLLENKLQTIASNHYGETIERLRTIPGVGVKTAVMLTVITDNFNKFENYKQLIAFIGFSPRIHQSGTSVRGKAHICKMGSSQVRKLLYMCSWSAKKVNTQCISMYNRLKEKGKPERVIKIALANKIVRQAFAIGKYERTYDEKFVPILLGI